MDTYEKKYNEALEKARMYRDNARAVKEYAAAARYENIFPQLRESEDERIRKALICGLSEGLSEHNWQGFGGATIDECLTYLEKQKEQKPISQEDFDTAKHEALWEEQKPAEWSEDDEEMLNSCISSIEESKENRYAYKETDGDTSYDREVDWLKSLRPSWKPSEEQMKALEVAFRKDGDDNYRNAINSLYNDLKKL